MNKKIWHILYLEDDPLDVDLARALLTEEKLFLFDLVCVSNSDEYQQELDTHEYDIVISDYQLPAYTGFDALAYLKKQDSTTPFVLVSGAVGDELAVEIIKKGAFDYVLKQKLAKLPLVIQRAFESLEANKAKYEWESMFHSIEKASLAGFFRLDPQGQYTYSNEYFSDIVAYSQRSLISKFWLDIFSCLDEEDISKAWLKAMKEALPFQRSISIEIKNGYTKWINISIVPEFSANKENIGFIGVAFDITDIRNTEKKLKKLQTYDPITQLFNKEMFETLLHDMLKRSKKTDTQFSILFLNIDDFKKINDTLGHAVGDKVLFLLGETLQEHFQANDFIAHFSADTFAVILDDTTRSSLIINSINKLFNKASEALIVDEHELYITLSIGIAKFPSSGNTTQEILQHADQALHDAKTKGKNTYRFYSEKLNESISRTVMLEDALRFALENDELYCCYQPQIDLNKGQVVAVEALCRWTSKALGEVSPCELIPLAEENGAISLITKHLCSKIFFEMEGWLLDNPELFEDMEVSINLSANILTDNDVLDHIFSEQKKHNLPTKNICFEITETAIMENKEEAYGAIKKLSDLGFKISIDDFGTGQSSLGYVKSLPVNILKIDASFIFHLHEDENDFMIVKAIINLAHSLNLYVIAEGVENEKQLKILKDFKCDAIQGFYFSKALPGKSVLDFIKKTDFK